MLTHKRLRLFLPVLTFICLGCSRNVDAAGERLRRPPPFGVVVLANELDGRHYYAMDPALTCRSNDPDRTQIRTWRQHIEIKGDKLLVWGQVCNDNPELLDLRKLRSRLRVSLDLLAMDFDRVRLKYETAKPQLCPAGTWCPVGDKP